MKFNQMDNAQAIIEEREADKYLRNICLKENGNPIIGSIPKAAKRLSDSSYLRIYSITTEKHFLRITEAGEQYLLARVNSPSVEAEIKKAIKKREKLTAAQAEVLFTIGTTKRGVIFEAQSKKPRILKSLRTKGLIYCISKNWNGTHAVITSRGIKVLVARLGATNPESLELENIRDALGIKNGLYQAEIDTLYKLATSRKGWNYPDFPSGLPKTVVRLEKIGFVRFQPRALGFGQVWATEPGINFLTTYYASSKNETEKVEKLRLISAPLEGWNHVKDGFPLQNEPVICKAFLGHSFKTHLVAFRNDQDQWEGYLGEKPEIENNFIIHYWKSI